MIQSYIVYNLMLVFSTFFAYLYSKARDRLSSRIYVLLSFLSIFIPAAIRYDVGLDYSGYVKIFEQVLRGDKSYVEYGFYLVNKMFLFSEKGYIGVMALYSFVTLLLIYKLSDKKYLHYTVFFFVTLSIGYFRYDNLIRQVLSIVIGLYSIRYIEEKNFKKYAFYVLLAFFVHYSAIVLLPMYFIVRIRIKFKITIIIFLVVAYFSNFITPFVRYVVSLVPYYGKYKDIEVYLAVPKVNTGIGVIISVYILTLSIFYKRYINRTILINFLFIGICTYLISSGNSLIGRISLYFTFLSIYTLGMVLYESKNRILIISTVLLSLLIFERAIMYNSDNGLVYKTIFSEEAKIGLFRVEEFEKE